MDNHMSKKLIALVGRPNVGKSTLFNRLSRSKKAIVHDKPGVTRDRKYADAAIGPLEFRLVDTPGLEEAKGDDLEARMMQQTLAAIKEADVTCLVIDNLDGVTSIDKFFANMIRKYAKKSILIINKCEKKFQHDNNMYKLGFGDPVPLSAEHGTGLVYLYEAITEAITETIDTQENITDVSRVDNNESNDAAEHDELKIVVAGRPNAGKSTFINALVGEDRLLTGPEAGITRESIEIALQHKGTNFKLIDTAGLRKRANVKESLERLSTSDTIGSINFANTIILMLDATIALEAQDLSIARYTIEQGRSIIIAVNKWDLIKDKDKKEYIDEFYYKLEKNLAQVKGVPVVFFSAKNDKDVSSILDNCIEIYKLWNAKISTGRLNDWLNFTIERHPLPLDKKLGRRLRMKYIVQIASRPPTFKIFCNLPLAVTDHYKKYLINSLRNDFNLPGVPIRIRFVKSDNPYANRKNAN